jgi:sec-independent protein translocase protein TatC
MTRAKSKSAKRATTAPRSAPVQAKAPFIEHIYELRKRLTFVALAVVAGGVSAYFVQKQLIAILIKPAGDQQFIFTSPGGGLSFVLNLCILVGIIVAIPVIVHQLLRYLQPLIKRSAMRFIWWGSFASGALALAGILFGYFFGLPASMHFLLYEFANTTQVEAMIAIQSYLSFVMMYLLGSALLFQVPLIMILINRIKPLNTKGLMKFQRWFAVIAFVLGAIISPSPNVQDQLMLSVPMILMYQLGIVIVWFMNRKHRKAKKVEALRIKDQEAREARMSQFHQAQESWLGTVRDANGGVVRQAPSARTWQEPTAVALASNTVVAEPTRSHHFDQPQERRSYQAISVHAD